MPRNKKSAGSTSLKDAAVPSLMKAASSSCTGKEIQPRQNKCWRVSILRVLLNGKKRRIITKIITAAAAAEDGGFIIAQEEEEDQDEDDKDPDNR